MSKIMPDHRERQAYVYVRQSTPDQLLHNHESRRRQYALADRARALGWSEVVVVDDDLGRSGGGIERPGVRATPGGDLRSPGRYRVGGRGVAAGPQRPGLAHPLGVLWPGGLPAGRRGRSLRSATAE